MFAYAYDRIFTLEAWADGDESRLPAGHQHELKVMRMVLRLVQHLEAEEAKGKKQ